MRYPGIMKTTIAEKETTTDISKLLGIENER